MKRRRMMWSRIVRGCPALAALVLAAACGNSAGVEADPAVAPFVGTWDAEVYEIWPESDPDFVIDVLTVFGDFHITVEPSGQYTAVLEAPGSPAEIGQLTVIGATIRLDVTLPANEPSRAASYSFTAEDYLLLDGAIEVDFNGDQTRDPGGAHIELRRR
jgi:hypothetical protein